MTLESHRPTRQLKSDVEMLLDKITQPEDPHLATCDDEYIGTVTSPELLLNETNDEYIGLVGSPLCPPLSDINNRDASRHKKS